ncbi:MAG: ChaN family lipoprotein [Thermodesulfobacteriota bacterium]|nr:ChaN family lipoprotein [Thermodesulfobacteriota bacterium]
MSLFLKQPIRRTQEKGVLNLLRIVFLVVLITAVAVVPFFLQPSIYDKLAAEIISTCQDSEVIILGEKHQHPDSQKLLLAIVNKWTNQNKNIFIGLEIPRNKQELLDSALTGSPLPAGTISTIIDHTAYREMIRKLESLPVTVKAIDAAPSDVGRDRAMEASICPVIQPKEYDEALVLVGNLHAIKRMKWHPDTGHSKMENQYLAGRLVKKSINVCSVTQDFSQLTDNPKLLTTKSQEGSVAAMRVIGPTYHDKEMSGEDVADAVIVW